MYFFFLFLLCQILLLCVIYVSMIDIGKMNIYFSIFIFPFFLFVCAVDVVTEMVRLGIFIFLLFLTLLGVTSSSSVRHVHSWQQFFFCLISSPDLFIFWQDLPRVCECEQVQFTSNNIEDDTPQILLPWTPCQEMQLIVTGGQLITSFLSLDLLFPKFENSS